jgi:hypothetical protein
MEHFSPSSTQQKNDKQNRASRQFLSSERLANPVYFILSGVQHGEALLPAVLVKLAVLVNEFSSGCVRQPLLVHDCRGLKHHLWVFSKYDEKSLIDG